MSNENSTPQGAMVPAPNAKKKYEQIRERLTRLTPQLAAALPRHLSAERMVRLTLTCFLRNPELLECDALSIIGAVLQCAQLGLEPDPVLGEAFFLPFRNKTKGIQECNFVPGYKGLVKLAYQSGVVSSVEARAVHAKDQFDYCYGVKQDLRHVLSTDEDAGGLVYAYCILRFKDGRPPKFEVMPKAEIERHRFRSKRASTENSPWMTDYDAMAIKTVVRVTMKLAPLSTGVGRAVALDERNEIGVSQELAVIAEAEKGSLTAAADAAAAVIEAGAGKPLDALAERYGAPPKAPDGSGGGNGTNGGGAPA